MGTLKDYIKIDNRFEKSVNLFLDLCDLQKIDAYIPTKSSVKILADYLGNVVSKTDKRASILVGPYGKGKSHLLLVLLTLLSKVNSKEVKALLKRILAVSPEYKDLFDEIGSVGKFLPVIINQGEGTLNKAFYKGLMSALDRENLSHIVPDSYYSEAIRTIKGWETEYPEAYKMFKKAINESPDKFVEKLSSYNEETLEEFKKIYPSITSGSTFNPIVDDEIISVYRSVNRKLREEEGFAGIYIVFDEFSKYIEGHKAEGFASDMKTLQDMCELCLASKDEQLHLTCVAHRSIKTYSKLLSKDILNSFEGVSGRLSEVLFVVSSKNNYELIADAIVKKPEFAGFVKTDETYKEITKKSFALKQFSSLFTESDFNNIVAKGCYPLTPIASMLLLELCEKVAQNERTIFTYITGKDRFSLARAVNTSKATKYIGIDHIYDYFSETFKKDEETVIHHEWLKAEYAIGKLENENDIRLIKSIAVIRMIAKDALPSSDDILSLALGISDSEYKKAVTSLIENGLIVYKKRTLSYDFKNNIGIDLEAQLSDTIKTYFSKTNPAYILNEVNAVKYILPKKHNQEFCITRYFNTVFIRASEFLSLADPTYLDVDNCPDGHVLFILPDGSTKKAIIEHIEELGLNNLAVIIPKLTADITDKAHYLAAIRKLKGSADFAEDTPVLIKELSNIEEDVILDINDWISENYLDAQVYYKKGGSIEVPKEGLNRVVSDLCDITYTCAPIVNHELINRHVVSAQISKARDLIIKNILSEVDPATIYGDGASSADATIYRAIAPADIKWNKVNKELDKFYASCVGKKAKFSKLILTLTTEPFGMRKGIIPILLCDSLMKRSGTPIIYLNNKEVVLSEETLSNIVKKPEDYSLFIEASSAEKDEYLKKLNNLFSEYSVYCKDVDAKNQMSKVACLIQSWYRSLPQTSVTFTKEDKTGENMREINSFRHLFKDFYLNPRDVLFDAIPAVFKSKNLDAVCKAVAETKQNIDAHIHILKEKITEEIRADFGFNKEADLRESLKEWYDNLPTATKNRLFYGTTNDILEIFTRDIPHDEELIAGLFAKAVFGMFAEDWSDSSFEQFSEGLKKAIEEIEGFDVEAESSQTFSFISEDGSKKECSIDYNPAELSTSGNFLKNALTDALEEYGDVTDNTEKIGILLALAKELMNK